MSVISAGLLLYRRGGDGGWEVLLVHPGGPFWARKDLGAWSIPKGELEEGEEPAAAAEREFAEETGQPPPPGPRRDLGEVRQKSGKRVRAFAAAAGNFDPALVRSNEFEQEWPPHSGRRAHFPEIDRAGFFPLDEAARRILPAQAPFLQRFQEGLAR